MSTIFEPRYSEQAVRTRRDVATRWGGNDAIMRHGFVPVATAFLWYASQLTPDALKPAEVVFVLHLVSHKRSSNAPYPSYESVAKKMGVSVAYCRKLARDLERRGFMRRTQRLGDTNLFDLAPLFERIVRHVNARFDEAETQVFRENQLG